MIIIPPEEIQKYITVDENGQWIHDPAMPLELQETFQEFLVQVEEANEYKRKL